MTSSENPGFFGRLRVKTKFILLLVTVAYISITLVSVLTFMIGKKVIDQQIKAELELNTEVLMNSINKMIYDRYNDMQLLVADSSLTDPKISRDIKTNILRNNLVKLGWYHHFYLTDSEGLIVISTNKSALGRNLSQEPWYQETQQDFIHVSDVTESPLTQKQVLFFGNTLADTENHYMGTLFASVPVEILNDLLKKTPDTMEAYLLSRSGRTIASKSFTVNQEGARITPGKSYAYNPNYIQNELLSQGYLGFRGNEWRLIVQIPKAIAYAPLQEFNRWLWITVLGISMMTIIMGSAVGIRFIRPIQSLLKGVTRITRGDLETSVDTGTRDEFGYLAKSFNRMAASLKEKTEHLMEERGKYKSTLESSNEGILLFDQENRLVVYNKKWKELFHTPHLQDPHDLLRIFSKNRIDPASKTSLEKMETLIRNEDKEKEIRTEIVFKAPAYRVIALYSKPVTTEEGEPLGRIWVFREITEEKEGEKIQGEFISIASHKLRTPLTAISWSLQMLKDKSLGALNRDQMEALERIEAGTIRLNKMARILLNSAEIRKNVINLIPVRFPLAPLVRQVVQSTKKKFKSIPIRVEGLKKNDHIEVVADEDKTRYVLSLLLENACLYTDKTPPPPIMLRLIQDRRQKRVMVRVEDNGIGIPEKEKPRIFTRFFRGKKAMEIYNDGTGLNLFLAKIISQSGKEKIGFESEEGKGSVFYFTLKMA